MLWLLMIDWNVKTLALLYVCMNMVISITTAMSNLIYNSLDNSLTKMDIIWSI